LPNGCSAAQAAFFTKSVWPGTVSARLLDGRAPKIVAMDLVSILLGVLAFAVLFALIYGIERI
jgi:hypothetical protein